ncbi:CHRD domain-containing protein [Paraburkholderia sp.]|uniref:CHRD domain-containing protein n=1 Tax=Paraburkholderia sp. TaxID=1926495 RepID=UPI003C7B51F2
MDFSISRQALMVFIGFASAGAMTLAQAAPLSFTVPLTGAQQVPPVDTSGHGSADISYDPSTRVVTWAITFSGLSSDATMAHFHGPAAAGENAHVKVWLSQRGAAVTSPINGSTMLSPTDAHEFLAGEMYVHVHTKDHPSGEIRGQLVPPKSN